MDNSPFALLVNNRGLSAEGVVPSQHSPLSAPSPTSLDNYKKKVQQLRSRGCKNAQRLYFVCKDGHVTERRVRCHSRFMRECPYCGRKWRKDTVKRFTKIVSQMQAPKKIELTLRKGGQNKIENLSKLVQRCRFYLRRRGYKIRSFVFCIEPTNHVHCIWDCDYIPQREVVHIWRLVTGDSFVVWIKRVDKQRWKGAVHYVTKYITKISKTGSGMKGMHIIGSWGVGDKRVLRMICKKCGSIFEPLWDLDYAVSEYVDVEFVEIDPG